MSDAMALQDLQNRLRAKFGTRVKSSRGSPDLRMCCPFCASKGHSRDTDYKLWINPAKNQYRCWRCPARGTVSQLLGAPFKPIGKIDAPRPAVSTLTECDRMPGDLVRLDHLEHDHVAFRYMLHRGFNPASLGKYYGVSYCSRGRLFGGRSFQFDTTNTVVFPIWMGGKLVGWQARLLYNPDELDDDTCEAFGFLWNEEKQKFIRPPKYFTSPGLTKGATLYNYDFARASELVVVVEGPTDALAAGPCAVATLGKGVTDTQMDLLAMGWKVIVVLLDPDAAEEASELRLELAKRTSGVVLMSLQGYGDPGSAPTREIWKQIRAACAASGIDIAKLNLGPHWCEEILRK